MSEPSFSDLMQGEGVKPLQDKNRAETDDRPLKQDKQSLLARRQAATAGEVGQLTTQPLEWLNPLDPINWKRDGVQEGVYRNLRLGKYQVDARLDLMGKPPGRALDELQQFVDSCLSYDIRTVVVAHGRGRTATSSGNKLKSYLNLWLQHLPQVQAFHSTLPQHGGNGAVYVLLAKSEEKRLENWERHQKR